VTVANGICLFTKEFNKKMQLTINGIPLTVNIADDDSSRISGLMNSEELTPDTGLLFRWPDVQPRSFWMKDTTIPLDIAYISDTGNILNIEEMEPLSLSSVISNGPAMCALEVNRGWFDKNGIKPGDNVSGVFNDMPKLSEGIIREQSQFRLSEDNFYYSDVVDFIVADIMSALPDQVPDEGSDVDEIFEYPWDYPIAPDIWEEHWQGSGPFFEIELRIVSRDFAQDHLGWNIDGSAGWGGAGASIEIEMQFRSGLKITAEKIIELENELSNVVAHEIHHLTQQEGPFERPNCSSVPPSTPETYYEYFTSACEIPAFLIGFRAEASKSGRPAKKLMSAYLDNQVVAKLITTAEANDISTRWLNHSVWNKQK
jgi:uncharacterized membrane protein (UPF0127 family)